MISGLIDYAYTGEITITKHNVQSMLSAANLLEILPVRDACCQFLDKVRLWTLTKRLTHPLPFRIWTSPTVLASTALLRSTPALIS